MIPDEQILQVFNESRRVYVNRRICVEMARFAEFSVAPSREEVELWIEGQHLREYQRILAEVASPRELLVYSDNSWITKEEFNASDTDT